MMEYYTPIFYVEICRWQGGGNYNNVYILSKTPIRWQMTPPNDIMKLLENIGGD